MVEPEVSGEQWDSVMGEGQCDVPEKTLTDELHCHMKGRTH